MGIYRLTSGRFRRFEKGKLTEYVVGDLVDLDADEARRLARLITPVDQTAKGLSRATTPDLPDGGQDTARDTPASEDPDSAPAGAPVFTADQTPGRTVTELEFVIANVGEPSMLKDMMDAEREAKNRRTVLHLLETRRSELEGDGDEGEPDDKDVKFDAGDEPEEDDED